MLWTIASILIFLWALGMATSYTLGGFIHIFAIVALVALFIQFVQFMKARRTAARI